MEAWLADWPNLGFSDSGVRLVGRHLMSNQSVDLMLERRFEFPSGNLDQRASGRETLVVKTRFDAAEALFGEPMW